MVSIAVIIPSKYKKNPNTLLDSVDSIYRAVNEIKNVQITIIISLSDVPSDAIRKSIQKNLGKNVHILIAKISRGFAPAVNDGILYARTTVQPDWYCIVNDDALVHKNFFSALLPAIKTNEFDAISSGVQNKDGTIESLGLWYSRTGIAFPRRGLIKEANQIFVGTCVLLSDKCVEREYKELGYIFNPLFFAYAEDLELSLRIQRNGGKIFISDDILVTHYGSYTAKRGSFMQLFYGYRNLLLVILLLWSPQKIIRHLPYIVFGQLYVLGMSLYKRYPLLYPKILWWIWKHRRAVLLQRLNYDKS